MVGASFFLEQAGQCLFGFKPKRSRKLKGLTRHYEISQGIYKKRIRTATATATLPSKVTASQGPKMIGF